MDIDFLVRTERRGSSTVVDCSGELDIATCGRLEEALSIALESRPERLVFNGDGITLMTSAGISTLFNLARQCKDGGVLLTLHLSRDARRVLDLVGLWWLGVVDDGLSADDALDDALRAYAEQASDLRSLDEIP